MPEVTKRAVRGEVVSRRIRRERRIDSPTIASHVCQPRQSREGVSNKIMSVFRSWSEAVNNSQPSKPHDSRATVVIAQ